MSKRIAIAILFVMICTAVAAFLAPKQGKGIRERVRADVPSEFPIAVRDTRTAAVSVRRYRELAELARQPEISFLVGEPAPTGVTNDASSEGKQSLRVERRLDDHTTAVGWYHATDKEILPQYFELRTVTRDRRAMAKYGGIGFAVSVALALLFSMVHRPGGRAQSAP